MLFSFPFMHTVCGKIGMLNILFWTLCRYKLDSCEILLHIFYDLRLILIEYFRSEYKLYLKNSFISCSIFEWTVDGWLRIYFHSICIPFRKFIKCISQSFSHSSCLQKANSKAVWKIVVNTKMQTAKSHKWLFVLNDTIWVRNEQLQWLSVILFALLNRQKRWSFYAFLLLDFLIFYGRKVWLKNSILFLIKDKRIFLNF